MALKAYIYRFATKDVKVPEIGIAVVASMEQLFWTLDQFENPYEYEFTLARACDAVSNSFAVDRDEPDYITESKKRPVGEYLTESVKDTDNRAWRRFKYPHDEKYSTIKSK